MKNTNQSTNEAIGGIIQGLFYLSREAETSQLYSVKNLLITVIDDIMGLADNSCKQADRFPSDIILTSSSFLSAIEFLSKFASIKDSKLKSEILDEIKKCQENMSDNILYFRSKK
jgi:hypothetical protein